MTGNTKKLKDSVNQTILSKRTGHFYNNFSTFYPLVGLILRPQKRKLFDEINKLPYGNLLEIGVGNGGHFSMYKTHKIIGIDISSKMLEIAKKRKIENIELKQMNGEELLFPDQTFDYVALSHVLAVVDQPEKVLEEIYRVLKPNGKVFILNHFTPNNWLRHIDHSFQFFTKIFHFKSVFYLEKLKTLKKFKLLKELHYSRLTYFKLLIYRKE